MDSARSGPSLFETEGFSMWPFLEPSRRIVVRRVDPRELRLGDLVLYRSAGRLICHRFLRRVERSDGNIIYTQADAASLVKPAAISEDDLRGKVTAVIGDDGITSMEGLLRRAVNVLIVVISPAVCAVFDIYRALSSLRVKR